MYGWLDSDMQDLLHECWYFDIFLCWFHGQIKFSELTLDTFRMLQCLEWEPSGSFYQSSGAPASGTGAGIGQNGAPGPSRINYSQDIADPTLPPNPRKAILYRPSVTHFIAVSICPWTSSRKISVCTPARFTLRTLLACRIRGGVAIHISNLGPSTPILAFGRLCVW